MAGFFDGFFFHAILQWHHMLSNIVPTTDMHGMIVNMVADGWFDGFCWVLIILGIAALYQDARAGRLPSGNVFMGWILFGAGLFNFVEGLIDHEILRIHHVRQTPSYALWDLAFLLIPGLLFMFLGWVMVKRTGISRTGFRQPE